MKKKFVAFMGAVVLAMPLSGCAGGTGTGTAESSAQAAQDSASDGSETVISQSSEQGVQGGEAGERVTISEVELEIEIKPQDTQGMVDKLKNITEDHGGRISSLATYMYEMEEEETQEETEGTEENRDTKGAGETEEAEETAGDAGSDSYYDDDYYYDDYYDDSYYDYYDRNSGTLWTRANIIVPEEQADEIIQQLTEGLKVTDRSDSIEDYTVQYQNLTGRIASLEEEKQRLTAMLEDARSSGKARTSEEGSDFLEQMIALENNLWSVTKELNTYRYGDDDNYNSSSYYHFHGSSLAEFESRKGKTLIAIYIYVNEEDES